MQPLSLLEKIALVISILISLLVLLDFLLPGNLYIEEVQQVEVKGSSRFRKGRSEANVKIITAQRSFYALNYESVKTGDKVAMEISPFLHLVTRYQLPDQKNHFDTYSLRYFSSAGVPLIGLAAAILFIFFRKYTLINYLFIISLLGAALNLCLNIFL